MTPFAAPGSFVRYLDTEGSVMPLGKMYFYLSGTLTATPVYDADGDEIAQPITADITGAFEQPYLPDDIDYRVRILDRNDVEQYDIDPWTVASSSNIPYRQDTVGAVTRTVQSKLSDWVNVLDFQDEADGNDLTTALQNAIYYAFPDQPRLHLELPPGVWEVSSQIIVPRPLCLRGAGISETVIECTAQTANATMKGVFNFGLDSTMTAYDPAYGTKVQGASAFGTAGGSDFSEVSDLMILTGDSILDYGIWTAGRLFCANVLVFGGGFKWTAGTLQHGSGSVTGNANISTFYNCHSINASEDGFFGDGSDANACSIIACNAFDPTRYAFYDASFLGNTYLGCHGSGGTTTYKALFGAGANRTDFNNCYAEAGVGTEWDVPSPATINNPRGEMPGSPSDSSNVTVAGLVGQGRVTGSALNFLNSLTDTGFGSSSAPAFRAFKGGFLLRGQGGNGDIFQLIAKGQGIPGTPTYGNGASLVKRDSSGPTDYELMYFGDASNRPSFPRDFLLPNQRTPASATATGVKGEVCADANYVYVCTATDTWKRVAIATW